MACDDDGPTTQPTGPTVGVQLATAMRSVSPGRTGFVDLVVSRPAGYTGPVTLAIAGAPAGLTARFEPATLAPDVSSARITLALVASSAAKQGQYLVDVVGGGTGVAGTSASLFVVAP